MSKGQTLAALLVVILIIAIVAAFLYIGRQAEERQTAGRGERTTYGAAMERAKEVECLNNLQQIRTAVQMFVAEQGSNPPTLQSVRLPAGVQLVCPIAKVPYTYDPNTGAIRCPQHPRF